MPEDWAHIPPIVQACTEESIRWAITNLGRFLGHFVMEGAVCE